MEVFGEASHQSWFSDYRVITISASDSTLIRTEHGININADTTISKNPKVDVLLVPSAYNMKPLLNNKPLIEFIKNSAKTVDWMASNCSGAFLLGQAGLLDGKKATTWAGGEGDLEKAFPKIKVQWNKNVVVDGNIITSNGSLVSYEAALILLSKMSSSGKAKEVAEALQYTRIAERSLTLKTLHRILNRFVITGSMLFFIMIGRFNYPAKIERGILCLLIPRVVICFEHIAHVRCF